MSAHVSVIIPTLNEADWIASSVRSAFDAGAGEVLVTDGGSHDATVSIARGLGAQVIDGGGMRSKRMNAGFLATTGDVVCFLHADTLLPKNACREVTDAIEHGAEFGGFRLRFAESHLRLSAAAFLINARTAVSRMPWGDQAQFFRRDAFEAAGLYPEIPIMEDYDMARRMKRRKRPALIESKVTTSGRRFIALGVLATAAINWRIILAWHAGVPPEELRRLYGRR